MFLVVYSTFHKSFTYFACRSGFWRTQCCVTSIMSCVSTVGSTPSTVSQSTSVTHPATPRRGSSHLPRPRDSCNSVVRTLAGHCSGQLVHTGCSGSHRQTFQVGTSTCCETFPYRGSHGRRFFKEVQRICFYMSAGKM